MMIHKPLGTTIPDDVLWNNFRKNVHGWGIMYVDNGRVQTVQSLSDDFYVFLREYHRLEKDFALGIHFRERTVGEITLDNCHPHKILDYDTDGHDLYLMHRDTITSDQFVKIDHFIRSYGVLTDPSVVRVDASDSRRLVKQFLSPALRQKPSLINEHSFWKTIGDIVHEPTIYNIREEQGRSRFLLLDHTNQFRIVDSTYIAASGYGCWFSDAKGRKRNRIGYAAWQLWRQFHKNFAGNYQSEIIRSNFSAINSGH